MAVVNFRLDSSVLNTQLDSVFNGGGLTYTLYVQNELNQTISGASVTCDFDAAVYDSVNKLSYVDLASSVFVPIPSGTTIGSISLQDNTSKVIILNEPITAKTYSSNGTYTVSNLTVKLGE